jgi:hypothetical protein
MVEEGIRVWMRNYFAAQHLWTARSFAVKAAAIETGRTVHAVFDIEHRAYVVSSIISAVAFMEAAINELLQDAADEQPPYLSPLPGPTVKALAELWRMAQEKWAFLDKYQAALLVAGKEPFNRGALPYQDADLLRGLRNIMIHAKPETSEAGTEHKLEKRFKSKFPANRLMKGQKNPYFPDRCLGSGCAEWAVKASIALADEFFSRMGLIPHYKQTKYEPETDMP